MPYEPSAPAGSVEVEIGDFELYAYGARTWFRWYPVFNERPSRELGNLLIIIDDRLGRIVGGCMGALFPPVLKPFEAKIIDQEIAAYLAERA